MRASYLVALIVAVGAPVAAAEPTWRGRPVSDWIDISLGESDERSPIADRAPWCDSAVAVQRWDALLATRREPWVRRKVFEALMGCEPREACLSLLRDALARRDPDLVPEALAEILVRPGEFPELVPEAAALAPADREGAAAQLDRLRAHGDVDGWTYVVPDAERVACWIDALEGRSDAGIEAGNTFSPAVACPALARAIRDRGTGPVPSFWIEGLHYRGEPRDEVQAILAALMDHPDPVTRRDAVTACWFLPGARGAPLVGPLLAVARNPTERPDTRRAAIDALGMIGVGDAVVVPALAALADDAHPEVRGAALEGLGDWGPSAARFAPLLLRRASDPAALAGLQGLGRAGRAAAPGLTELVLAPPVRDDSWDEARALASILGRERLARDLVAGDPRRHERAVRCILTLDGGPIIGMSLASPAGAPIVAAVASELTSSEAAHRSDALALMVSLVDETRAFVPAVLAALGHRNPATRETARAALVALARTYRGPSFRWEDMEPLLGDRGGEGRRVMRADPAATRSATLAALAAGAVPPGRAPALRLAAIADSGAPSERIVALRALAWHVRAAPDVVASAARDAALGADEEISRAAVHAIVELPCFPAAEREEMRLALEAVGRAAPPPPSSSSDGTGRRRIENIVGSVGPCTAGGN